MLGDDDAPSSAISMLRSVSCLRYRCATITHVSLGHLHITTKPTDFERKAFDAGSIIALRVPELGQTEAEAVLLGISAKIR